MASFNLYSLNANTRHDIYALTGITPGTQVKIQNKGVGAIYVSDEEAPINNIDGTILPADRSVMAQNDAGDMALTVYSTSIINIIVNVVV